MRLLPCARDDEAQRWDILEDGRIRSRVAPDQCLDVFEDPLAVAERGTLPTPRAWECNGSANQQWDFVTASLANGQRRIRSRRFPTNGYLDVYDLQEPQLTLWKGVPNSSLQTWTVEEEPPFYDVQPQPSPSSWRLPSGASRRDIQEAFFKDQTSAAITALNSFVPHRSQVRFATFNVHYWTDLFEQRNFQGQLEVIGAVDADVFALQEVSLDSTWGVSTTNFVREASRLAYKMQFCQAARVYHGPFGNSILSRLPSVATSKSFSLPPEVREGRCATRVTILMPDGGALSVYSIHLDVFDSSGGARLLQIQRVLKEAETDPAFAKIIMGDYNEARGGKVTEELEARGWSTSFAALNVPAPKTTVWAGKEIDFIYLSPGFPYRIRGTYVWHTAASDHLPVILDVEGHAS